MSPSHSRLILIKIERYDLDVFTNNKNIHTHAHLTKSKPTATLAGASRLREADEKKTTDNMSLIITILAPRTEPLHSEDGCWPGWP